MKKLYILILSLIISFTFVSANDFSKKLNSYKEDIKTTVESKLDDTSIDENVKEQFKKVVKNFKDYIGEGNYEKAEEYLAKIKNYSEKLSVIGLNYGKDIYKDLKQKYQKIKKTEQYKKVENNIKQLKSKFLSSIEDDKLEKAKEHLESIKEKLNKYKDNSISYGKDFYKKLKKFYEEKQKSISSSENNKIDDNTNTPDMKSSDKTNGLVQQLKEKSKNKSFLSNKTKEKVKSRLEKIPDEKKEDYYNKILDRIEEKREKLTEDILAKDDSFKNDYYIRKFGILYELDKIVENKLSVVKDKINTDSMIKNLLEK